MPSAFVQEFEAGAARAGERQLDHLRFGDDRQVLAVHHRPQERSCRARPRAALDVEVHGADALGRGDVHVVEVRHPAGLARVDERGRHRVQVPGPLDADRAARTAERTRAVLPVLRLLEQGQDGAEVPAGVAGRCPGVVVGPVAAGPEHAVDTARAAEYLPERQGEGAAGDVRARLVTVSPVVGRTDVLDPLWWVRDTFGTFARSARL